MRLSRMYINGFGSFHDLRIEGLSPGLTVFRGQNESGKTTLLSFIRSILFGFPDGRSNENLYLPLAGKIFDRNQVAAICPQPHRKPVVFIVQLLVGRHVGICKGYTDVRYVVVRHFDQKPDEKRNAATDQEYIEVVPEVFIPGILCSVDKVIEPGVHNG